MDFRHREHGVGERGDVRVSRVHERDDDAVPRLHFPEVRGDLLVERVVGRQADDGERVVDEGDRAVLHLAAGIALRVEIRDLLELERSFEGDRVMRAAPEEENVPRVLETAGEFLDLGLEGERLAERGGEAVSYTHLTLPTKR